MDFATTLRDINQNILNMRFKEQDVLEKREKEFLDNLDLKTDFMVVEKNQKRQIEELEKYQDKWKQRTTHYEGNLPMAEKAEMMKDRGMFDMWQKGVLDVQERYRTAKQKIISRPQDWSVKDFEKAEKRYLETGEDQEWLQPRPVNLEKLGRATLADGLKLNQFKEKKIVINPDTKETTTTVEYTGDVAKDWARVWSDEDTMAAQSAYKKFADLDSGEQKKWKDKYGDEAEYNYGFSEFQKGYNMQKKEVVNEVGRRYPGSPTAKQPQNIMPDTDGNYTISEAPPKIAVTVNGVVEPTALVTRVNKGKKEMEVVVIDKQSAEDATELLYPGMLYKELTEDERKRVLEFSWMNKTATTQYRTETLSGDDYDKHIESVERELERSKRYLKEPERAAQEPEDDEDYEQYFR
jgi:hypothetical protein